MALENFGFEAPGVTKSGTSGGILGGYTKRKTN
jgi:hypothetical protein